MTQTDTQSVRSNAEAAVNTNRIPTFDEVYAMPYVQASIDAIINRTVRQFPLLSPQREDIRQEMLVALNKALPKYDRRSGICTFCRTCLENSAKEIRRRFYRKARLRLLRATDIDDFHDTEVTSISDADIRAFVRSCPNTVERDLRISELMVEIDQLPAPIRAVAMRIFAGESIRDIEREQGIPHASFHRRFIKPLKKAFEGKKI